jgi:hypothetical protein
MLTRVHFISSEETRGDQLKLVVIWVTILGVKDNLTLVKALKSCINTGENDQKPRILNRKALLAHKSVQNRIDFLSLLVERAYAPRNPDISTALLFP